MSKTIQSRQPAAGAAISEWPADLHPVLARIYAQRDINTVDELDQTLERLLPFAGLTGIEAAVDLLTAALERQQRILVVGDFDADGATSCAVAVRALRLFGAQYVDFLVPNRFDYGYGLTPEIVDVAVRDYQPDLIVTVDNGISSLDGVSRARETGVAVLITDHHLAGATLPDADAIVNPNQPGDSFASKHLAGVGVIFYVMWALRSHLCDIGWFDDREPPKLGVLLDLVALGTVADVVRLDSNNRILVAQGLRRIRAGRACAGIQALIAIARRQADRLVAADLGFALGPRLNAAGRLDDMTLGIRCLLSEDEGTAMTIANRLDEMNKQRRLIETEMQQQALETLEHLILAEEGTLPFGLCLYDSSWHQGVIGLLAARIKERFHRPVIAFADGDSGQLKGSARSVPGLHIRDVLDAIAAAHPGLLYKFGGHAMAAGLTLATEMLETFSRAFDVEVRRHLNRDDLRGVIYSDGQLTAPDFSLELAEQLRNGGPWGQGFPEPVFDGRFNIRDRRVVGDRHLKLILEPQANLVIDAIAFNTDPEQLPDNTTEIQCAYRLDVNEFRGQRNLQMIIEHIEPV